MLADAMVRMSRKPDRRYAIDPAQLGLQFRGNGDPVSRAVSLWLRSLAGRSNRNLPTIGDRGMATRVASGDVGQALPWLQQMLGQAGDLSGYEDERMPADMMPAHSPKDAHDNRPIDSRQAGASRLMSIIDMLHQLRGQDPRHPSVQAFLPGSDTYREANASTGLGIPNGPSTRRRLMDSLPLALQGLTGAHQHAARQNAPGVLHNDLESMLNLHGLLSGLVHTPAPEGRSQRDSLHREDATNHLSEMINMGLMSHPARRGVTSGLTLR
jgi:hypothetical protein